MIGKWLFLQLFYKTNIDKQRIKTIYNSIMIFMIWLIIDWLVNVYDNRLVLNLLITNSIQTNQREKELLKQVSQYIKHLYLYFLVTIQFICSSWCSCKIWYRFNSK